MTLGSRTRSPDTHLLKSAQQEEPQTTMKPAHNHRIWGTPLLTEQMGKMFISDGICLSFPIPTDEENTSGLIQVTL